ncbi:MAG: D-sedoheptulose 7-phosphate isomerase [Mariprofundaceae bacterium]
MTTPPHFQAIIRQSLEEGIELRRNCLVSLETPLTRAARLLRDCLGAGGKALICGNGGSAADAQHFAAELVNRFEIERPGLPAIALTHDASVITSIANDYSFDRVFARQVEALGQQGDVLIAISTSGNSPNVLAAHETGREIGMQTIALTGRDGGRLGRADVAVHLNIPHRSTARVQEMHITCLHILCSLLDTPAEGEHP